MTDVLATCPCGAPILRDPKRSLESARERSRKFCSRTCGGRFGGGLAVKAPEVIGTCPCGTAIMRNPRRSRWSERNRRYCSRACSADARRGLPFPGKRVSRPALRVAPVVEPERPVWRPPGWAAVPQVAGRGR